MKRFTQSRGCPASLAKRWQAGLGALLGLVLLVGTGFVPEKPAPDPPCTMPAVTMRAFAPEDVVLGGIVFRDIVREDPVVFAKIEQALARGQAGQVLAVAGAQVEIRILGRGTLYSRSQALYVLAEFLEHYPPARFVFSKYASADGRRFAFGSYWVRGHNIPLQVYVNLRQREGVWELRELRVEAP